MQPTHRGTSDLRLIRRGRLPFDDSFFERSMSSLVSLLMSSQSIYRVTVRGRFHNLDDRTHAYLVRELPTHDIFVSAYTTEGTFTYDKQILFFNLRYEIRTHLGIEQAESDALVEAETFLRTLG